MNELFYRCNDVLELVQTTRHFRLLADAAEVGGAGSQSLDALVKEIHLRYTQAMEDFFAKVSNVLSIDGTQAFERAFFTFRTVVKVRIPSSVATFCIPVQCLFQMNFLSTSSLNTDPLFSQEHVNVICISELCHFCNIYKSHE